jgi:hypothetical protein
MTLSRAILFSLCLVSFKAGAEATSAAGQAANHSMMGQSLNMSAGIATQISPESLKAIEAARSEPHIEDLPLAKTFPLTDADSGIGPLRNESEEHALDYIQDDPSISYVIPTFDLDGNGRTECVELIKGLLNAPRTAFWRAGRKVNELFDLKPGTAIATFVSGKYPQSGGPGTRHAAIFVRRSDAGIYVIDQFARSMGVKERFIPWHHPRDNRPSNNASRYYTIQW